MHLSVRVPGGATGWPASSTPFWALGITWNVSNGKDSQEELQKHFVLLDLTVAIKEFPAFPQVGQPRAGYPPSACSFVQDEQGSHLLPGVWCQGSGEVSPAQLCAMDVLGRARGCCKQPMMQTAHDGAHFPLIPGPVPL